MTEPTEPRSEQATPAQWIERLEIFRERFRLGLIDEQKFKDISRSFQFGDQVGHLWMPGATTNQWYRWDRNRWTAATPPARLTAADMPLALSVAWGRGLPSEQVQPTLPVRFAAPGAIPQPSVAANGELPSTPSQPVAASKIASPEAMPARPAVARPPLPSDLPEQGSKRPGIALPPSDLPERGTHSAHTKPTDLPK